MKKAFSALAAALLLAACQPAGTTTEITSITTIDPKTSERVTISGPAMNLLEQPAVSHTMRWGARQGGDAWTQATLRALDRDGAHLMTMVPRDVAAFCPSYASQSHDQRRAFWAGLLSSLAKHESSYNPQAKGGGGKWLGLMQIAPATAKHYGCGGSMLNGSDNMACAVKIMAKNVGRDNAIAGSSGAWRGVARDWMPMRSGTKRADIAGWTAGQSYCR